VDESRCTKCGCCVQVCPSAFLLDGTAPDFDDDLRQMDYPCHLVHSPDDAVRLDAASGGGITGLILHLMETGQADGAVVARCTGPILWRPRRSWRPIARGSWRPAVPSTPPYRVVRFCGRCWIVRAGTCLWARPAWWRGSAVSKGCGPFWLSGSSSRSAWCAPV
ncbi:MAG TPA: hypothetical protein ENN87_14745, partial [Phycisphaerales bacterium]|nr:hypothetical protein [Phycisphaerales bacterium]